MQQGDNNSEKWFEPDRKKVEDEPDRKKVEEMPKYAALVSKHQTHGVAPRYGASVVYWKQDLKNRVTHTPGDSWNLDFQGALMSFTSTKNTEVLFAHTDEVLLRLAAAEATGQDQEFLEKVKSKGGVTTDSYIETQIHGKLTWEDVDEIVIGLDEKNPEGLVEAFKEFALENEYKFTVSTKPAISPGIGNDK